MFVHYNEIENAMFICTSIFASNNNYFTAVQISQYTVYDERMAELTGRVTGYQSTQH